MSSGSNSNLKNIQSILRAAGTAMNTTEIILNPKFHRNPPLFKQKKKLLDSRIKFARKHLKKELITPTTQIVVYGEKVTAPIVKKSSHLIKHEGRNIIVPGRFSFIGTGGAFWVIKGTMNRAMY